MRIGYIKQAYTERRNIINQVNDAEYVDIHRSNFFNYILRFKNLLKLLGWDINAFKFSYQPIRTLKDVNIIHSFNTVC